MNETQEKPRSDDLVRELEAVLNRRLRQLESDNEKLRRTGALLLIGLLVMVALTTVLVISSVGNGAGRGIAEVVEARSFLLRDADGHARGEFGFTRDGGTRLLLQDRDGRERLRLTLLPDGSPGLSFTDVEGRTRAVLGLLPDETTTLVFADRTGRTRTVLGVSSDESSTLVFADRNGETRVGVGVEADGSAGMTLFERDDATATQPETLGDEAAAAPVGGS
jgi:hypothetical protein